MVGGQQGSGCLGAATKNPLSPPAAIAGAHLFKGEKKKRWWAGEKQHMDQHLAKLQVLNRFGEGCQCQYLAE